MKTTDALLDAWRQTLQRLKGAPAILNSSGEVLRTFADVEKRACDFESKLETFKPGSVIAIQIGNHEDWPAVFIACLRSGLVVLPLELSMADGQRDAALELCRASAIVSVVPGENSPEVIRLKKAGTTPEWEHQPSLLKLTSGTTASPRAVRFRSEQLLADCHQICDTMEIDDADLNFGLIPISHSYGFSNLLTPLIARGVPMVVSRDRTPRAILADLSRTKATVLPGMPIFYQALCEMQQIPPLPTLRLCISAGAPLSKIVARKFQEKFDLPIHPFYGASECGGICYDRETANDDEGFVGGPMEGVDIEMVESNAPASQIRVRSAAVGDGYFPQADEEKLSNGVFLPDDLLARHDFGLKIVGRISDLINVAGKKVNPSEVEAHLLRFDGVRQAIVFGRESPLRSEEVAACVVASRRVRESDLLRFCRAALSAWQVPKRIFVVDTIPVNERGKISRRHLAERFSVKHDSSPL
jgi:acyl-CoA synthetase (AMP-forming)/AMP-acid ligase II